VDYSDPYPADSEQFMLIEELYKQTDKLQERVDSMLHNEVNISALNKAVEKLQSDVEKLKDKQREFGNGGTSLMPSEIIMCVALCMFMDGKLVEHTYQKSMSDCLRAKRIAERTIQPERVQFACGPNIKAEVEYVEEKGQTEGRTRILRVIEHGYEDDQYDRYGD
jgi:uncharacterized membrane protein (DUF106 family)